MAGYKPTGKFPLGGIETIVGLLRAQGPVDLRQIEREIAVQWDETDARQYQLNLVMAALVGLGIASRDGDHFDAVPQHPS